MRRTSILIMFVIAISLFSTGASFQAFQGTRTVSLQTLDVCHTAAPIVNPELPYISVCPCVLFPLTEAGMFSAGSFAPNPLLLSLDDEHPPEPLS
jgi:hypothetical protein